jgi:hypothetical protein
VSLSKEVVEELEEIDENNAYWWTNTYETLQCRGCSTVCLRHTFEDPTGEHAVNYYPPPIYRRPPRWRYRLPQDLRALLDEIYQALQNDSRSLATMGTRTLVDMFMLQAIGDTGSFAKKLNKLRDKGLISPQGRDILEAALDAGSAAAHRGYKPEIGDLVAVMDIVENLLEGAFQLPKVAARLKKSVPPRPKST